MKLNFIGMMSLILSIVSTAEVPKDPLLKSYSHILEKNPFQLLVGKKDLNTNKLPQAPKANYQLKGVTEMSSGWLVVIAPKGNAKESIILKSDQAEDKPIKIIKVDRDKLDYRKTIVKIEVDGKEQIVKYNPANLIVASKAVVKKSEGVDKPNKGKPNNREPIESKKTRGQVIKKPEEKEVTPPDELAPAKEPEESQTEEPRRTRPRFKFNK